MMVKGCSLEVGKSCTMGFMLVVQYDTPMSRRSRISLWVVVKTSLPR